MNEKWKSNRMWGRLTLSIFTHRGISLLNHATSTGSLPRSRVHHQQDVMECPHQQQQWVSPPIPVWLLSNRSKPLLPTVIVKSLLNYFIRITITHDVNVIASISRHRHRHQEQRLIIQVDRIVPPIFLDNRPPSIWVATHLRSTTSTTLKWVFKI